ncbi:hypothetical protein SCWH03_55560 [Streptomyces pacificus]|uniref:Uncharacterized protein n=1 Tax=Streptomyces pacificus TaxID=2705029 RepID=A0A6A0B436_9ACTN|nr:hypothetical protein SCWH03_55560 [Streptomyces pacificus]
MLNWAGGRGRKVVTDPAKGAESYISLITGDSYEFRMGREVEKTRTGTGEAGPGSEREG